MKVEAREHKALLSVLGERAEKDGLRAWAVGGCVRDWLLGLSTKDIDIVTEGGARALAEFAASAWGGCAEVFGRFGTVRLELSGGLKLDFAAARKEIYQKPAALPKVSPATLTEDLFRRDFTANALAASILPGNFGEMTDNFNSVPDISAGVLRVLHDKSFTDDPTRLYRAARFAGRFGWKLSPETEALFEAAATENLAALLSRQRLCAELLRLLEEKNPGPAFAFLEKRGLLAALHASLKWSPQALSCSDKYERLGVLACNLGGEGAAFLKSLCLERAVSRRLKIAVEVYEKKASPEFDLDDSQLRILRAVSVNLPLSAFSKLLISGGDLRKLGFRGKKIRETLDSAARAQWRGEFSDKVSALSRISSNSKL